MPSEASPLRGLRRFVLPAGQAPMLDEAGFLRMPVADWPLGPAEVQPRPVTDLLSDRTGFALLAAGGAGKTETFRALAAHERNAQMINAAPLTRDGLERELAVACDQAEAVYLDGLDQAAVGDPFILQWLEQKLTTPSALGISWRLACRSAAWERSLAGSLRQHLPGFAECKLLPLDRAAAEEAVTVHGFDGAAFIRAVAEARLGRLSACVGQLIATARYWKAAGGLPAGGVAAMVFEIEQFLRETSDRRRPQLPAERAMRLAMRLGAFTAFGGRQTLTVAPGSDQALAVDELPTDPDPAEPGRVVEPDDYREILSTALFDPGPAGCVVFRHQRYVEYLAAAYLVERGAVREQVTGLVGTGATGVLPAAMIGVVAWLAALEPELVRDAIDRNASVLASAASTVELPDGYSRAAVVDGLLNSAARDEQKPGWGIELTALAHHGLGEQLLTRLSRGLATSEELWWVSRLAMAGKCPQLSADLAVAAHDTSWTAYARRAAVAAVDELGDDAARLSLRDLLHPEPDDDPDNEVLSAVIDALYPQLLSTEELTRALRPHSSGLIGGYYITLRDLADRVPVEDLAQFAAWFASTATELDDDVDALFDELFDGLVRKAWEHADIEPMRDALAQLLVISVVHWHRPIFRRRGFPWTDTSADRRRALAVAVAGRAPDAYVVATLRLLTPTDTEWLLDYLATSKSAPSTTLADCLPMLLHEPSAAIADTILAMEPQHPAYAATFHLRESVDITAPGVQAQRQMVVEDQQFQQQQAEDRRRLHSKLTEQLGRLDEDPSLWWQVACLLAGNSINHRVGHDFTQRPGWAQLDALQQQRFLDSGVRYLDVHQPQAESWWGGQPQVNPDLAAPDWSGVHLMTTLLLHDPDTLAELEPAIWQRWARPIIGTWMITSDEARGSRQRLLEVAPPSAQPHLIDAALAHIDELEAQHHWLSPREVYDQLAPSLTAFIADRLSAGRYSGQLANDLLDLLTEHGPPSIALNTCRQLADTAEPALAASAKERQAALDPAAVIDALAAEEAPDPEMVAQTTRRLNIAELDRARLNKAAALLLGAYSYSTDPPMQTGYFFTARDHARDLCDRILQQLAAGGHVDDLVKLKQDSPKFDQQALDRYLWTARARRADLALTPTSPRALLDLLRRGDARLVRDDADLAQVILRQLDRLQHDISHDGAFREIWNSESPQVEDDISDWIRRRFHDRITPALVVDREVQVARLADGGIGTRIDLTPTARTDGENLARVVIEAKRIDNDELMTAMNNQLIERYLVPMGRQHGIYLVYWIKPEQRPPNWPKQRAADPNDLLSDLRAQAREAQRRNMQIVPYILDISRP